MMSDSSNLFSAALRRFPVRSLQEQLLAEAYMRELEAQLSESDAAIKLLRDARGSLRLRDLENVLLRFDETQAEKWRQYILGTLERKKAEAELRSRFEKLLGTPRKIASDHPVSQALAKTRDSLKLQSKSLFDDENEETSYFDRLESAVAIPALREWFCRSLRRILNERK